MKKLSILASAILLCACNSTPNNEENSDVNRNYVVSVAIDKITSAVEINAPSPFFDLYEANSINKQPSYITADYIRASYQALVRLYKEQVTSKLRDDFIDQISQGHKLNKGSSPLKLAQEMLYSLSIGMMLPVHSREVGKEFSMIYKAEGTAISPTLNSKLEYGDFSINSKICELEKNEARVVRLLAYINAMNADLLLELFALHPELAKVSQSLVANSKSSITNIKTTPETVSSKSCFDYMLVRSPIDLSYALKNENLIKESLIEEDIVPTEQDLSIGNVKNINAGKGVILLSTTSVELEENTQLYHEIVLNLKELNKQEYSHDIAVALPLFKKIEKLSNKKAEGIEFNDADKQFLNSINKKLAYTLTGKAKPYLALSFQVDNNLQENITAVKWHDLYKATELTKQGITYKGIKICNKAIDKAELLDSLIMEIPSCD